MNAPEENSRPAKLTHAQTVLYEIDMLKFTAGNFGRSNEWSSWSNLECFLLHFRNLIEFFGKPADDRDTLSILKPGSFSKDQQKQEVLKKLYRNDLWAKYEVRKADEENDKISRYLQHCTEERVNDKSWKV
jgi:cytochrome P450